MAVDPHITGEDEEIIAKDVKDAAGQYAEGRQPRSIVIPQKRRQQLIEQEKRENILDGPHIALRQRKQRFIRAEEGQDRALKAQDPDPCQNGQKHCADHCGGKILMFASVAFSAAAPCAEDHAAADAHQKAEAVDDVPYRRDDCQRRRSLRPVVLPDHCRVYDGIDRGDHCAAKRGRQVFEVHRFDVSVQEVHAAFLLLHEKTGQKTDISVCLLSGCRFYEQRALRANKAHYSTMHRTSQASANACFPMPLPASEGLRV